MEYKGLVADIGAALKRPVLWVRDAGPHTYWEWAGFAWCEVCGKELKDEAEVLGVGFLERDGRKVTVYVCKDRERCRPGGSSVDEEPTVEKAPEGPVRDSRGWKVGKRHSKSGFTEE